MDNQNMPRVTEQADEIPTPINLRDLEVHWFNYEGNQCAQYVKLVDAEELLARVIARQAAPEAPTEPVGEIVANDPVHGWHMKALKPWNEIGEGTLLYAGAAVACGMCNDSGIVGFPPDQYESCPDCTAPATQQAGAAIECSCDSPAWCKQYGKCHRIMCGFKPLDTTASASGSIGPALALETALSDADMLALHRWQEAMRDWYGRAPAPSQDAAPLDVSDAMVDAYLAAQRAQVEQQDQQPFGVVDPRAACRAGLRAALARAPLPAQAAKNPSTAILHDGVWYVPYAAPAQAGDGRNAALEIARRGLSILLAEIGDYGRPNVRKEAKGALKAIDAAMSASQGKTQDAK